MLLTAVKFNLSGAEAEIFSSNWLNVMAADDLVMQGNRSSAAMVLTVWRVQVLVFHEE